ncbi:MAG: methyltransferase domain-containing protein [Deltaproteobacteria bacterium]|nr:methyltransferase domain-containing protein [Deltaproteobacteria bacterium]MBW2085532.1 methyltransferase domain-containing protein [Deltaproteobacteria bacterium]
MSAPFDYNESNAQARYDKGRSLPPDTLRLWAEVIARHLPRHEIKTILDLGCGTGRFTALLAETFSARVYGIEPSEKMLSQAREKAPSPSITFLRGSAEDIPLPDHTADMLFLSMVFHHIQNKEKAIIGFRRALRGKGYVLIRTSTRQSLETYFWLQFFPKAMEIELSRAPDRAELIVFFKHHGFDLIAHPIVNQRFAKDHMEYFEKLSTRALSSLEAISDQDFHEGLARLKAFCHRHNTGQPVYEEINFFIFQMNDLPFLAK